LVERMAPRPKCWHIYYGDVHVGTIAERVASVLVKADRGRLSGGGANSEIGPRQNMRCGMLAS
jgi:hypothetical protein